MKKLRLFFVLPVLFLLMHLTAFAQVPAIMNYQAVIRNSSNALVINAPIGMKVSILQGSATGIAVFEETHLVNTNANGLVTVEIGNGTLVSGSIATIIWTTGPFFIKTETDPNGGTDYTIESVAQMMTVPYAFYAETSGSSLPGPQGPEGPEGPEGPMGPQGPAGEGMEVNCLQCHNHNPATASTGMAALLDHASSEYEHSKHAEGIELAIEEGYSTGCSPCHADQGFHSVVDNNTIPTYTLNPVTLKYSYSYNATAANSSALNTFPGNVGCFTCHKGNAADSMALTTIVAVPMTMYAMPGATKTIDLPQQGGSSNLCAKCHQPRPINTSSTLSNGASLDYADLAANPMNLFYDANFGNAAPNKLMLSYRTGVHYGTVGAIFAGQGAVEFTGTMNYANGTHSSAISCAHCHMAQPTGFNGGHSFRVSSYDENGAGSYNFKGCITSGCHTTMTSSSSSFTGLQNDIRDLLLAIADKLRSNGVEILHKDTDPGSNLWAHLTDAGYDGYLDIYDPSTNAEGAIRNPAPSNSWTVDQKAYNLTLPALSSLLNVQMGAIVNFQLCLRDYTLGVHNPSYTTAVLNNTLEALTDAGF